jgi:glycosyltransferase involved in cell wall biosynthesis
MLGLSAGFVRLGHQVVTYGDRAVKDPTEGKEILLRAENAGIQVQALHPGEVRSEIEWRRRVLSALASNRDGLDALVIHGVFGPSHPAVERACRRGGIPCVACPHDPYAPELFRQHKMLKTTYWHLREAPLLRKMRAIQVLAPSHARYLQDLKIDVPVFASPNGLERHQFEPSDLQAADDCGSSPTRFGGRDTLSLLFFGRLDVYTKGLDLLLEAVAADEALRSSVDLQIAGRGQGREERTLRRLITSLRLEAQASLVGYLPDPKPAVLSADFVIVPSRRDGFAQAVIETLALGTPVIVSRKAGSSEYFGREQGALLTEPDVSSLIRTLRIAFESRRELRHSAVASRARLAREFNWDEVARHWIEEAERHGALHS